MPNRALIRDRVLPLEFLENPERLCFQAEVPFNHLDICKPSWPSGRPQRIYTWSREAIAVWLRWVPQGSTLSPVSPSVWSAQLASELAAMQAAMIVKLGGEATEPIYYSCGEIHLSWNELHCDATLSLDQRCKPPHLARPRWGQARST
jgi:hypothetical protein